MKLRFVYLDCVAFFRINFHSTAAKISSNYSQQVTCFHVLNIFACNTTLRLTEKVPIHKILIFASEGFPALTLHVPAPPWLGGSDQDLFLVWKLVLQLFDC